MKHPLIEKLTIQLKELMRELTVDIPKQLEFARSLGDLSENAEYKMTKERQLFVESRIKNVEDLLQKIQGLNLDGLPRDKAAYGSRVRICDVNTDEEKSYLLVFPGEEPSYKKSNDTLVTMGSPIALSICGKESGETVRVRLPKGTFEWEILEIETLYDLISEPVD